MLDTIKITSDYRVILSEDENSDAADVKFIICDFDPNANNVSLNRDTIEDWLSTLLHKPLVGKVVTRFDGKRDFSGHNARIVIEEDEDGNQIKSVEFDTSAFGSFYDVSIETIDEVEYIVAKAKLWKRYKEAYKIFKKRVSSKKGLKTSWEITVSESHQKTIDGRNIKVVDQGVFIGHALLGEFVTPAYKASGVLEVAEQIQDDEIANALSHDFLFSSEENIHTSNEGGEKMPEKQKNVNENSALTDNDIYSKVRKAINSVDENKWFYISMLYPYDYKAIAYTWDRASDEDFVEFTYVANSDDTISVTAQQDVKLRFVPVSEIESQVAELEGKLKDAEKEIAEAGKSITELTKEKETLESSVAELTPFKEKVEQLEAAEQERLLSEKKEELKSFTLEDELITSEELESDDQISVIFSELTLENYESSQEKIEVIKGRRAIQKFKETKTSSKEKTVETSETKKQNVKTDLNDGNDGELFSATDIVKAMLQKK